MNQLHRSELEGDIGQESSSLTGEKDEDEDEGAGNPPLPSRLATLNRFPQFLFPSCWNMIPRDHEIPYAFNHHHLSLYWTREDALVDAKFNIYVRPPCLNCIVACDGDMDGDLAKCCSGLTKQEWGPCARCVCRGGNGNCIEQIEVRKDGSPCGGGKASDPQTVIWTEEERRLRKRGIVEWRPINLQFGDVNGKEGVVQEWYGLKRKVKQLDDRQNWILPTQTREMNKAFIIDERITWGSSVRTRQSDRDRQIRLQLAAARVAEWDKEDLNSSNNLSEQSRP